MRSYWPVSVSIGVLLLAGCRSGDMNADGGDDASAPQDMSAPAQEAGPGGDLLKAPTCTDGVKNGAETDVDCGGGTCPACDVGKKCLASADCASNLCTGGKCVGPSCSDGVKDGDETDIDCGGSCPTGCRASQACGKNGDCASMLCVTGVCKAPGCGDGVKNGSETDVDCGGGACEQCLAGQKCAMDTDCATKLCDPNTSVCVGCGDGKKNGSETDVDCGGTLCAACAVGKTCVAHSDCTSHLCNANSVCQACTQDTDCPFKICKAGVCSTAPIVGMLNGQTFFKVMVAGAMTDTNVFNACKAAGLSTPCQAQGNCMYNDNACVMTQETLCGQPMAILAQKICGGGNPGACPALYGCYQYMGHHWVNDSACGAEQGQWCAQGNMQMNRFALCTQ